MVYLACPYGGQFFLPMFVSIPIHPFMRQILLFGAGKSSTALIEYLLINALAENWRLTVVDAALETVAEKMGDSPYGTALAFDITNDKKRRTAIESSDIVISLMPPALHTLIAKDCLAAKKNLLTASYVDDQIKALEGDIRSAGLLFLCEMGLDPGIDHMSAKKMIDDILQFSFIDGKQQKRETDLEELLSEVKELLSETIATKKAEIITDGLPCAFVVAPQISQLFQNLIANALKFSKENTVPRITITHAFLTVSPAVSEVTSKLQICIADNGIGFDDGDSEKIFGLFYRLKNKAQYEGTGLGLSICKKIVDKHAGTITAKSKIGEGSMFIIQLPQ